MAKSSKPGNKQAVQESSAAQPAAEKTPPAEKTPAAEQTTAGPKTPAAGKSKAAGKKSKSTPPAAPAGIPMMDTALAAESAARLLAARMPVKGAVGGDGGARQGQRNESALFKQLKSGMSKPAGETMSTLLDKHGGPIGKSAHESFGSGKQQQGRNQTFGADVNRAGVPRRTGGG